MTADEKIAAAIDLLLSAADDLVDARNRLWEAADSAEAAGADGTSNNSEGNVCDSMELFIRGVVDDITSRASHLL